MNERDPNIITSGLSRRINEDGVTIRLEIHRIENDPKWALEVINEAESSIVRTDLLIATTTSTPPSSRRWRRKQCERLKITVT